MNPFLRGYFRISAACVAATILLQNWVLRLLFQEGLQTVFPKTPVVLLSGTGAYFILYKVSVWVYEKWAWRKLFRSLCIDGTWFHTIECEALPEYRRRGRTQVRQELFSIEITGMNYNFSYDRKSRSLWRSSTASMDENGMLVFTYSTSRAGATDPKEKTGLMFVQLYGERGQPPERMEGIFQDASPSELRGSITWERQTEWSTKLTCKEGNQEIIEKIELPTPADSE